MKFAGKSLCFLAGIQIAVAAPWCVGDTLVPEGELHAVSLVRLWEARVPLAPGDAVIKGYLIDDAIYILTADGIVFSLQPDSGLIRWGEKFGERGLMFDRPSHVRTPDGHGPVIFPIAATLHIVDRYSGRLQHRVPPPFAICSPAVGWGNVLFAGGGEPQFHAVLLSQRNPHEVDRLWTASTVGKVVSTPVFYGSGRIVIATDAGVVYSLGAADKTLHWIHRTDGPIVADPFVDAGGIYVASRDRSVYKLDAAAGFRLWRTRLPNPLTEGPLVSAQTVYQFCERTGLVALDAGTGVEKWRFASGRNLVVQSADRDLLYTKDGMLAALDRESGKLLASGSVAAALEVLPNPEGDAVFLIGARGEVVCARAEGTPYLRRQQILAARERLQLPPPLEGAAGEKLRITTPAGDDWDRDPFRSRRDAGP